MIPDPITKAESSPVSDRKAEMTGFLLERTARRMKQFFQERLAAAEADITIDQWVILQELDGSGGRSQQDLALATFKDAPTVTRIIDLLCKKGLTHRLPDEADRRRFRIELTAAGREKIDRTLPLIRDCRRQAWQVLTEDEVERLVGMLNKVFDHLKD